MRPILAFALLLLLAAAGPPPAGGELLTGQAAYGGWQQSAPGMRRLIRPQDMPPPETGQSHANSGRAEPRPAGAAPQVPPGFAVAEWASGLDEPRAIRTAPDGDIFVAESGAGRVRVFRPGANGRAVANQVFADHLRRPFGIAFWPPGPAPQFVYVAETNRVVRYPYRPGEMRAAGAPQVIVPHLPPGGHWTRDLAISPDGRHLFVSVGSESNLGREMGAAPPGGLAAWKASHPAGAAWGDETDRADVLVFDPDGRNGAIFATDLRNCSGLAVQPGTGALWCAVNERDGLGDNLPPDYATRVAAGSFYGWPWFYIGDHPDSRTVRRSDLAGQVAVPDVLIQPHSAPLGITFYEGTMFPPEYRGDAFVALHGSWNRETLTGYKVIRLRMRNGQPTGEYDDFLTGFVTPRGAVWGRPVDVAVMRDGSLLVTEDGNGTIWRVSAGE